MAVSAADLLDYMEDFDWASFNDIRLDDESIENDLAVVANHRLQVAFNAAEQHYLHGAPEGTLASTPSGRGFTAYVVFSGRKRGVFRTW